MQSNLCVELLLKVSTEMFKKKGKCSLVTNWKTGPDGTVAMSLANGLVGT